MKSSNFSLYTNSISIAIPVLFNSVGFDLLAAYGGRGCDSGQRNLDPLSLKLASLIHALNFTFSIKFMLEKAAAIAFAG